MNKYLLLRNNKQTGPFSLEEMRSMQLKAYDLVWVEGKSAAWRYPGELEELKAFAPAVEEQPFDRFFKKPGTEKPSPQPAGSSVAPSREAPPAKPSAGGVQIAPSSTSHLYVYLPSTATARTVEKESVPATDKPSSPRRELTDTPGPAADSRPVAPKPLNRPITFMAGEEALPVDQKFSQPLEDIKRQYAEKVLNQRAAVSKKTSPFAQPVVLSLGVIGLLAAGILIGLTINRNPNNGAAKGPTKDQFSVSEQPSDYHPRTYRTASNLAADAGSRNNGTNPSEEDQAVDKKQMLASERKTTRNSKKIADSSRAVNIAQPTDSSTISTPKDNPPKSEAEIAKDQVKTNIGDYIFLGANKYSVGTFGGISDLQLTVSNRSVYALDLVVVEVQYIQSNKKIFKTENLYFHNIGGGSALMQEAPKSPRGVKVQYRITLISSKELGLSYTGL